VTYWEMGRLRDVSLPDPLTFRRLTMLTVTRQADYSLRLMIAVAGLPYGQKIATATIADQQKIPLPFLAKIVAHLALNGLVKTERGARGGVSLSRPSDTITILEIIEAIDGPVVLNTCVLDPDNCEFSASCATCEVFGRVQQKLTAELKCVTLIQLAARDHQLKAELSVMSHG
jgi:Rrf2 family protein